MYTLGLNAAFHDSAACLVRDGRVVAAAEEERFTHIKHGKRPVPFSAYELPYHAIDYCLQEANIRLVDVDHIAYSYNPYGQLDHSVKDDTIALPLEPSAKPAPPEWQSVWDPLFLSYMVNAPRQLASGVPHHLRQRFQGARGDGPYEWSFVPHHLAHAASAYYAAPFSRAATLTLDGRGERASTTYGLGEGLSLNIFGSVEIPHSLGLLYEQVTSYLGFLHSSDEYKVMALASYGDPRWADEFRSIIRVEDDGAYFIDRPQLEQQFGPKRHPGEPLKKHHFDLARSLQLVLEETVLKLTRWLEKKTSAENLCMAGGVALNCVMNTRIRDEGPFKNVWVQPAAGDAGTALGAALWVNTKVSKAPERRYIMEDVYLGPGFSEQDVERFLMRAKIPYRKLHDTAGETADILARGHIVGWFQGRMEFGPRALGARSILASPTDPHMQTRLNEIKDREDFRPVAPVVLEEDANHWFECTRPSPFMLFVCKVREDKAPLIPAVRHTDGTARVQTIREDQNPLYHQLIKAFKVRTGIPVLINTSFNTKGEPIVCNPEDAIKCFYSSPLDALVMGPYLVEKEQKS